MLHLQTKFYRVNKVLYIALLLIFVSCKSEYQKILSSTNYENQYNKAMEYYEQGDYYRAYELFEKALPAYRLSDKAETINFNIADCYYKEQDYLMAAYYFERFTLSFPASDLAGKAQFLTALSYFNNTPKYSLDQTYTNKALSSFQTYLNKFPNAEHVAESNNYIKELREKLERKSYENAKLFYDLGDYRAAVISLQNCIKEFPDSKFREDILYYIFESGYYLYQYSVEDKKEERLESAIYDYQVFIDEFSQSKKSKDAERYYKQLLKESSKIESEGL